jgi:hypothetical protein
MTDRPPPKPLLNRNDGTRKGDEPTNQFGLTGAPETPAAPSGKR